MKLVNQATLDDDKLAEECELHQQGHKRFMAQRYAGYCPAWDFDGVAFQLTLHEKAEQTAPVLAFASGRVRSVHKIDAAVIEIIGVMPPARGQHLGVKIHELIIRLTGLPLVAAHVQTPQGRNLWLRTRQIGRGVHLGVLAADGTLHRVDQDADIEKLPFDLYDGSDATFLLDKKVRLRLGGRTEDYVPRKPGRPRKARAAAKRAAVHQETG